MTPKEASRSEPLSPEEEADLRADVESSDWAPLEYGFRTDYRRLLATLDAARAEAEALTEEAADMAEDWTCPGCDEDHGSNLAAAIRALRVRGPR